MTLCWTCKKSGVADTFMNAHAVLFHIGLTSYGEVDQEILPVLGDIAAFLL